MSGRTVIGLGGSRAAGLAEIAAGLRAELGAESGTVDGPVISAYDYAVPPASPSERLDELVPRDRPEAFDAARFFADLRAGSVGKGGPVVAILGPLSALPAAREACGAVVFVEVEERLSLLRWADILMGSGALGGVEALLFHESSISPHYAVWSADAKRLADIVLDGEDPAPRLASKIAWFVRGRGAAASASETVRPPSVATQDRTPADTRFRLEAARALERRLSKSRPPNRLGPALRTFAADRLYPAAKRVLDVGLVSLVLSVAWPVYILVALLIWLDDPGPVIYMQTRVGRHGKVFPFPKFRSMVMDAEKLKEKLLARNEMTGGITFKMKRDPRVIPIGRVVRRFSLDELPQLYSILRGDLTLVGPRPPVPREVALYTSSDRRRLESTPGLTCIWQVSGRSDIPFPRQVELDVEYLERRSLLLDLRILAATIPAVVTGKGAY
jgi:lipopolysaccharide/colanic/teichoic acid biosynthesis glycosyltransferase